MTAAAEARARDTESAPDDANRVGRSSEPGDTHAEGGSESTRIVVAYGFWIFLLADSITFACFFAGYAVLRNNLVGGPGPDQLFELTTVGWETAALLASSFACGLASLTANREHRLGFTAAMAATATLGLAFLWLEGSEFARLLAMGAGPERSGFLSAFFALVGLHGIHVAIGLLWLATMVAQVWAKGFRDDILRRILCFALFWHALDIIWVGLFTNVYLMGSMS